jgi:hypothetical protein
MGEPVAYDFTRAPEDERIILAGPPRQLTGRVDLRNQTDVDVVLRDASISDRSGVLTTRPLRQSLSPVVLRPNQERSVPLTLAVDAATPPGEYAAELDVAGHSRPVMLHVVENFDLTVQPQSIVVLNVPGRPQQKRVVVTNDGNVSFALGDLGDVDLEDDVISDHAVRFVLEPWTGIADQDTEEPVLALLRVGRKRAYRESAVSIRKLGDTVAVAPGETMPIDLEITVRAEMPQGGRYRGRAALLTRDLEIIVVSSGAPVENAAPMKPVLQTAKTAGSGGGGKNLAKKKGGGR